VHIFRIVASSHPGGKMVDTGYLLQWSDQRFRFQYISFAESNIKVVNPTGILPRFYQAGNLSTFFQKGFGQVTSDKSAGTGDQDLLRLDAQRKHAPL
jgi:hypothetical protein